MESCIGKTLSHYEVLEKIGAGGMGEVYRAHDTNLEREVAIKILRAPTIGDVAARQRLRTEALTLSKLNHPNVATIFDFATHDGIDFVVMELVAGTTLTERLRSGPLPDDQAIALGLQVADGLVAAHQRGIIHRDLKPANLRLTTDGRLKILDFGLAMMTQSVDPTAPTALTSDSGSGVGTLPYMAPEQLMGGAPLDGRVDIYALGHLLYEMITGYRAFREAHVAQLVAAILHATPPKPRSIRPSISPALETLILKAMEKNPTARFQTVGEMRAELERVITSSSKSARPKPARKPRSSRGRIRALTVLPLRNLADDPEQEFFADGMTEAIITDLAKIHAVQVISPASAMRYKGTSKSLAKIASELHVDAIVEGSVQVASGKVRITARLIDVASNQNLWGQNYMRPIEDVLQLQSEVAQAIASEIRAVVTPEEKTRLAVTRQTVPEAHVAYLKGRHQLQKWTAEALKNSIALFRQAIDIDPTSALAYAGMADALMLLGLYDIVAPSQAFPKSKASAERAIQLEPELAQAHVAMAQVALFYEWDVAAADRSVNLALQLNPSCGPAYEVLSIVLSVQARHDEALRQAQEAERVDPLSPAAAFNVGWLLYVARRYDESIACIRRALELDPHWPIGHLRLGLSQEAAGQVEAAIESYRQAMQLGSGSPIAASSLAHALASTKQYDKAQTILDSLVAASSERYVSSFAIAVAYIGMGNTEAALDALEKAVVERSSRMLYLPIDPRFDKLRDLPRFNQILHMVRLESSRAIKRRI